MSSNGAVVKALSNFLRDSLTASQNEVTPDSAATSAAVPLSASNPVAIGLCVTDVEMYQLKFTWIIKNFKMGAYEIGDKLESSTFKAGPNGESEWRLRAYPRGTPGGFASENYLALYLLLVSCKQGNVTARVEFSIFNIREMAGHIVHNFEGTIKPNEESCGLSIEIDYNKRIKNYLFEGAMYITCKGTVLMNNISKSGYSSYLQENVPRGSLVQDFGALLESGDYGDFTICAAGKDIPVHKGILAARSSWFATMFAQEMVESKQKRVVIPDMYEVVKKMLAYIYTGELQDIEDIACDLLVAADKYDISELKVKCEEVLCSTLTMENAKDLLVFAHEYNANRLKAECIYYISTHEVAGLP